MQKARECNGLYNTCKLYSNPWTHMNLDHMVCVCVRQKKQTSNAYVNRTNISTLKQCCGHWKENTVGKIILDFDKSLWGKKDVFYGLPYTHLNLVVLKKELPPNTPKATQARGSFVRNMFCWCMFFPIPRTNLIDLWLVCVSSSTE